MISFRTLPRRRRHVGVAALVGTCATLAALASHGVAFRDDVQLVSGGPGLLENQDYERPDISADGRYVMFTHPLPSATAVSHVWLRDLVTGSLERASVAPGGAVAGGDSYDASLSADGNRVAFASEADGLSEIDDNDPTNVFVRVRSTGQTILVNRQDGTDGAVGSRPSFRASISPDGYYVAFTSVDNGFADAEGGLRNVNVFMRDLKNNTLTLINRADDGTPGDGDGADYPVVSRDGKVVAFQGKSPSLSGSDNDAFVNVYVHDVGVGPFGRTRVMSRAGLGNGANGDSTHPAISDTGRYVVFQSEATNLSPWDANGAVSDIYRRDRDTDVVELVSRADGFDTPGGNGGSYAPDISADGRFVTFSSDATNLVGGADRSGVTDVYVRDMVAGRTYLVSRAQGANGAAGDASSGEPAISADGVAVAFESSAGNLSDTDADGVRDIFRRELLGAERPPVTTTQPPTGTQTPTTTPTTPTTPTTRPTPPVTVQVGAAITGSWSSGKLVGGRVRVTLFSAQPLSLRVTLNGQGVTRGRNVTLPGGSNRSTTFTLPAKARPGTFTVGVQGAGVVPGSFSVRLPRPRQGIARRVRLSTSRGSKALVAIPRGSRSMFVGYEFDSLPLGTRRVQARFTDPAGRSTRQTWTIIGNGVQGGIRVGPGPLRRGTWRLTLRVRAQLVHSSTVRVR